MVEVTQYKCETCGKLYETEATAWNCEASHLTIRPLSQLKEEDIMGIAETLVYICTRSDTCVINTPLEQVLKDGRCPFGIKDKQGCVTLVTKEGWKYILRR